MNNSVVTSSKMDEVEEIKEKGKGQKSVQERGKSIEVPAPVEDIKPSRYTLSITRGTAVKTALETAGNSLSAVEELPRKTVQKIPEGRENYIMCLRCQDPFEPLDGEYLCPNCMGPSEMRYNQLFGNEDPYSPKPTNRSNKIAKIIPRKAEDPVEGEKKTAMSGCETPVFAERCRE
ncbi:MAG: hypothetical protein HQL31_05795 [Planctomycetes bacterium]|nr:hypothetical protein [Planctomycetota bacterium]